MRAHPEHPTSLASLGDALRLVHSKRSLKQAVLALLHGTGGLVYPEALKSQSPVEPYYERLAEAGLVAASKEGVWTLTESGRQVGTYLAQCEADDELDLMFSRLECQADSVFLDLGCGAGPALLKASELPTPPQRMIGIDIDRSSLVAADAALAGHRSHCLLIQADLSALPIRDGAVTHVSSRLSLPYVDQRASLAELGRIMAPGSKVFLQVHSVGFYLRLLWDERHQWKRVILNGFCLLNGVIFALFGVQLKVPSRQGLYQELYQTSGGMAKILQRQGIAILWSECDRLFRIFGKKTGV
jgi:SAM-dependent methyltransferase